MKVEIVQRNIDSERSGSAGGQCRGPSAESIVGQGLPPELVLIVEVGELLPTFNNSAVVELEDNAAVGIQLFAVALRGVVMQSDDKATVTTEYILQYRLESPFCLTAIPA